MYTVLRIGGSSLTTSALDELGRAFDAIDQGIYRGIRRDGVSIALEVANHDNWEGHVQAIATWILRFDSVLKASREREAELQLDTALGQEDVANLVTSFWFDVEFIQLLAEHGVALEITLYGLSTPDEDEHTAGDASAPRLKIV